MECKLIYYLIYMEEPFDIIVQTIFSIIYIMRFTDISTYHEVGCISDASGPNFVHAMALPAKLPRNNASPRTPTDRI